MLSACPSACLDSAPSTSGRHGQTTTQQAVQFSIHTPRTAAFSSQIRHSTRRAHRGQLQTLCAIKKKSEKNLVCSKTLTIKPEHKDQVLDMCRQASLIVRLTWFLSCRLLAQHKGCFDSADSRFLYSAWLQFQPSQVKCGGTGCHVFQRENAEQEKRYTCL